MLPQKYSHLKIQILKDEYKYVLFENATDYMKALSDLSKRSSDFLCFSFKGENSLICAVTDALDNAVKSQEGWVGLKIVGEMPFGTVQGLIALISGTLFKEEIGVCIVSTFKTDLFLVKKDKIAKVKDLLSASGWEILE